MNWLDGLMETVSDKVPKNFYTLEQIAITKNTNRRRVAEKLKGQMKDGKIVMKQFRVKCGQQFRTVAHYGPK